MVYCHVKATSLRIKMFNFSLRMLCSPCWSDMNSTSILVWQTCSDNVKKRSFLKEERHLLYHCCGIYVQVWSGKQYEGSCMYFFNFSTQGQYCNTSFLIQLFTTAEDVWALVSPHLLCIIVCIHSCMCVFYLLLCVNVSTSCIGVCLGL